MLVPFLCVVIAQPAAPASPDAKALKTLVPFPHPLISEVLYNVPGGVEGDADGDGVRSATGDEFVELVNPHDKPISLKGYTLTDGKNVKGQPGAGGGGTKPPAKPDSPPKPEVLPEDDSRVRFVFPDVTLEPGQVVVIFNGYTGEAAPKKSPAETPKETEKPRQPGAKPEPKRLSMEITSQYAAFANGGDCVLLSDAEGKPVQCITWGSQPKPPDDYAQLIEHVPEMKGRGSVTRVGLAKGLVVHREQTGDMKGLPFSPGVWEARASGR